MYYVKIGIVILNYINYEETIKCVKSILQQEYDDYEIVVVDNGSKNESFSILEKEFNGISNVQLIRNKHNLGYAKGNNKGIQWLLKRGYKNIIVCNSDIEFTSPVIIRQIVSQYKKGIGVITPIIKNLDGSIEMRAQYRRRLLPLRVLKELIKMQFLGFRNNRSRNNTQDFILPPGVQEEYFVITGSIFMLTSDFFEYYNGLYSKTFLYVEELATLILVYKGKLKCAIANTDPVLHKGGGSTSSDMMTNSPKKNKMISNSARKVMLLLILPRVILKGLK